MINPYSSKKLINNIIGSKTTKEFESSKIPKMFLSDSQLIDCNRIADGSLTPIDGFMIKDEIDSILNKNRLLSEHYFPLPILLSIPENIFKQKAEYLLICNKNGNVRGYIKAREYFCHDPQLISTFIFRPKHNNHPGLARFLNSTNFFIGGKVFMTETTNELSNYCYSPVEIRQIIKKKKLKTIAGFQTRNVPHLAHEYLHRLVLELVDGLFLHPIIGWKKTNDYQPNVVMTAYNLLKDQFYPEGRVILSGLQLSMLYAGPNEAILHAIIRQNYGCTHFIVGRDHAGVGNHYNKYEAHKLAEKVQHYLDVKIICMKGPFYCKRCGMIATENTCGHDKKNRIELSGTATRKMLLEKKKPPTYWMREEIFQEISKHKPIFIK